MWFLLFLSTFCGLNEAGAQPSGAMVEQEILLNPGSSLSVENGQLKGVAQGYNSEKGTFQAQDQTHRLSLVKEDSKGTPIWRLTETKVVPSENRLFAQTSTFYANGLRSRTSCASSLNSVPGSAARSLSCATASRRLCERLNEFLADPEKAAALYKGVGLKKEQQEFLKEFEPKSLALVCAHYTDYMGKVTEAAALTDRSIGENYGELVKVDTRAVVESVGKVRDWGKTTWRTSAAPGADTNSSERAERLKQATGDLVAQAALIDTCNKVRFAVDPKEVRTAIPAKPAK